MKKRNLAILGCVLVTSVVVCGACGKNSEKKTTTGTSMSNTLMGETQEREIVLDASKISECKVKQEKINEITGLIEGKNGYEKENQKLQESIKNILKDSGNAKEAEVFISNKPIF